MSKKLKYKNIINKLVCQHGFSCVGIAHARLAGEVGGNLEGFVESKFHGEMAWMEERREQRSSPDKLWPEAKSAVVVGLNYGPDSDPMKNLERPEVGVISVYAQGKDYHDVIKGRLKNLAGQIHSQLGCQVKVFVDTAPLMEKPLAQMAGIGWQGKHTCLVSREFGSWLFLGVILTDVEIEPDEPEVDHCGTCQRCIDICPTQAIIAPGKLDARRCISYLTIEHKGHIAPEFREAIGNRVYGCDDCLAVCPWNKFAAVSRETAFHPREELRAPLLEELAELGDADFRKFFAGSPIKRIGRDRFIRNVLIAIGNIASNEKLEANAETENAPSQYVRRRSALHATATSYSGISALAEKVDALLSDESPLVRAMAVWALGRLTDKDEFANAKQRYYPCEEDAFVKQEWERENG